MQLALEYKGVPYASHRLDSAQLNDAPASSARACSGGRLA
ncbi:MAG: hypothetical protein B7Y95_01930 [Rhizobiales bacterium 32-66-11]|nr:MAG: hypothetical protein B7Y95_01930 [Rhizobiales bacterium 32-66-11]